MNVLFGFLCLAGDLGVVHVRRLRREREDEDAEETLQGGCHSESRESLAAAQPGTRRRHPTDPTAKYTVDVKKQQKPIPLIFHPFDPIFGRNLEDI